MNSQTDSVKDLSEGDTGSVSQKCSKIVLSNELETEGEGDGDSLTWALDRRSRILGDFSNFLTPSKSVTEICFNCWTLSEEGSVEESDKGMPSFSSP